MSVQSEITRLANAKTALATAIEGKGVTVPEGTKLDGMAALVDAIEAGASDIVVGSFTLTEGLTTSSPLYIDITFPKNELPFMYCVFEDERNFEYADTSHTNIRIMNLISVKTIVKNPSSYDASSIYMSAGSSTRKLACSTVNYTDNGYPFSAGVYGSMVLSLNDNQIMFKTAEDGGWYLAGRTYYYILCWG